MKEERKGGKKGGRGNGWVKGGEGMRRRGEEKKAKEGDGGKEKGMEGKEKHQGKVKVGNSMY